MNNNKNYHLSSYLPSYTCLGSSVGGTGDSYQQKKLADMEKQVKDLRKQNTEMVTSNQ